ncbi:unnamed protein product [Psylliodes chrysocephalus]|uniref:Transposase n=1 Tax=Psylliodes chrysocephalus TaxID=3402493 RepID=A0A9P0CTV2_9CUCU|nr:unnamed protein product [Psylliodes chrysocephala]
MTCHWLDEDLKRQSVALTCQRFAGTHSYERIAETLEDIHKKYNLDTTKLLATVTDNVSIFVKLFKEFDLNIGNKEHSAEEDSDSEEKEDEVVFKPIILSDSESTLDSSNFTQERCASHTINLIATTDYKNSVNGLLPLRQKNTLFSKCSKLWNKCGRPKSAEIIQEELGHKLKVPGITRWNSTYNAQR